MYLNFKPLAKVLCVFAFITTALIFSKVAYAQTTPPVAKAVQTLCIDPAPTLANIIIDGTDIKWYTSPMATSTNAIPNTTVAKHGFTYYATQTLNGVESSKTPVNVVLKDCKLVNIHRAFRATGVGLVADMEIKMSSSASVIIVGTPMQVFYKVTNVGAGSTNGGALTLTVNKPAGTNTFTPINPLPNGWVLQGQTASNFVFTTNKVMNLGDSDTIVMEYTSNDTIIGLLRTFQGRITNGSGGEINFTNNTGSFSLLLQAL